MVDVAVRDRLPAYIPWGRFESNQDRLAANRARCDSPGAPRQGPSLLAGLQPGSATVEVSFSPFRNVDPGPIAASLNKYPYGCTEQVTSAMQDIQQVTTQVSAGSTQAMSATNDLTRLADELKRTLERFQL